MPAALAPVHMAGSVNMARRLDVLLVEDDEEIATAIADLLRLSHEVRIAPGLREAIALLAQRVPDAIVCDLEIPPYRGDVLLSMVAREHPHVRRVLHSSYLPSNEDFLSEVAHVVLPKPSTLSALLRAIDGE
jgi:DNA-binding NtrC family response regulator